MDTSKINRNTRRRFLQRLIKASVLIGIAPLSMHFESSASPLKSKIPRRPLGKTGYQVGIYSLGGQGTLEIPGKEELAMEIINRALDLGVNYIDTSATYGRPSGTISKGKAIGTSERNIGNVLKYRRDEVFLATKTNSRGYDGSMRFLEQSLKNLQTDHIDLWQIHDVNLSNMSQIDRMYAKDGVIRAMEKARDEKIVRFLGFTGHQSPIALKAINDRYPFDNVLMALNAADKYYDSFIEGFLMDAVRKNMGIVGMKIVARDRIFSHGGIITMKEAMEYVLSLPVSTIIVGIDDIRELEENVEIARNFQPLNPDQMLKIEDKVKPFYKDLLFFKEMSPWPKNW